MSQGRHGVALAINIGFFVANVAFAVYLWTGQATHKGDPRTIRDAEQLKMDAAYVNDDLAVFLDEQFPRTRRYLVADYDGPLLVRGDIRTDDPGRVLSAALGEDFEVRFSYSMTPQPAVDEITIVSQGKIQVDLNADGTPDERIGLPDDKSPASMQLFYNGVWHEVNREAAGNSKYSKTVQDGTVLRFDREKGQWLTGSQENAQ